MFGGKTYRLLPNAIALKSIFMKKKRQKKKKELDLEKNIVIGHIGRFNPQKNHKFLIDIFEKCFEKNQKSKINVDRRWRRAERNRKQSKKNGDYKIMSFLWALEKMSRNYYRQWMCSYSPPYTKDFQLQ